MESKILELAISQGIWCALFVVLFYYTIRENKRREERMTTESRLREERSSQVLEKFSDIIKLDLVELRRLMEAQTNRLIEEINAVDESLSQRKKGA